jgi:hypothetical protein
MTISTKTAITVSSLMIEINRLVKDRAHFEQNEFARSNKRLYEILASIFKTYKAAKANKTVFKETVSQMKTTLLREGGRVQGNTLAMTLFVRFVFRNDRQRAYNYSRTLQAADTAGIEPEALAQFIEDAGGVEQCKKQYIKPATMVDKEKKIKDAMPLVEEQLESGFATPLAEFSIPAKFVEKTHDKDMMFLIAKASKNGKVSVVSAVPGYTIGMANWAKNQLALFLTEQQEGAEKLAKGKRKTNALSKLTGKAKKNTADTETVEAVLAA